MLQLVEIWCIELKNNTFVLYQNNNIRKEALLNHEIESSYLLM